MVDKFTTDDFSVIFERIKHEIEFKSVRQLAEMIDKDHSTILAAKKKNDFPASWAYIIEKKYGLLTGWIMTGRGPKRLEDVLNGLSFYEELEQWAKETAGPNTTWLKNQIESFFPMFKEWRKRRDEGEENKPGFPSSKVA